VSGRLAFVFPGQGSQEVGMGMELAAAYPEAEAVLAEADAAFATAAPAGAPGPSLRAMLRDGPDEQLTLTEHAQPAILAVSIAAYRVLASRGLEPALVAGHSLGEYSAHVASGTFSLADAVAAVRRRGRYMQDAVPVGTGAMAAIIGADDALVEQACEEGAEGEVVSPANLNAPGQIVIAGHAGAVARASDRAKALGARRAIPLAVSAPFHCALLQPAQARLEPVLRALRTAAPRVPIVANVDAAPKCDAGASMDALVQQVSSRVRWVDVVQRLAAEGVTHYIEVGPGTVLAGFIKRIQKDARIVSFSSPGQLDAVMAACSN
jgi:[acyl-carrier-protein] S-malonyltransferase